MSINSKHIRECVIRPVLKKYDLWTPASENLLMGTAAVESDMGTFLMQNGRNGEPVGPALGIFQMEPATYFDTKTHSDYYRKLKNDGRFNIPDEPYWLILNLELATVMCRLKYTMIPEKLPKHDDIVGLARYWKEYYNTSGGKGSINKFIERYDKYCGGE
jgi:hypothetical protein